MGTDVTAWPDWPPCVRAVVFNDQDQVLLLLRGENTALHPATWCLPGGGKEDNENFYAGAVRELLEETGLSAQPDGRSHSFGFPGGFGVAFGFNQPSRTLQVDLHENQTARWFDLDKLPKPLFPGTVKILEAFAGRDLDHDAGKDGSSADQRIWVDGAHGDGATPFHDLPILKDRARSWHAAEAEQRVRRWASSDGSGDKDKIDWSKYATAFSWVDSGRKEHFGAYKLPFADVEGGKLVAVPRGVFASGAAIMGSRGGVDIPEGDAASVRSRLAHYYRKVAEAFNDRSIVPPWEQHHGDSLTVFRIDHGAVGAIERTDQGFLRADGYASRVGVLTYVLPDGTIRRELRHPDDVTNPDSLATLIGVPVTDEHPPVMVTSKNAKTYSSGFTGDSVQMQGEKIAVPLTVTDAALIDRIDSGTQRELSCGYNCELVMGPGTWRGQEYDARQTNIRYNHLAVVRRGRAGPDVRLRLDAAEQVDNDETEDPSAMATPEMYDALKKSHDKLQAELDELKKDIKKRDEELDAAKKDRRKAEEERDSWKDKHDAIKKDARKKDDPKDGGEPDGDEMMDALKKEKRRAEEERDEAKRDLKEKDEDLEEAKKDRDKEKGRADALEAELNKRNDSVEIETKVNDRIRLMATAAKILPSTAKLDGLTDRQVREAVIRDVSPEAKLDGASEDYVTARFDAAVEAASRRVDSRPRLGDTLALIHQDSGTLGDPVKAAQDRHRKDSNEAWRQPVGRQARSK